MHDNDSSLIIDSDEGEKSANTSSDCHKLPDTESKSVPVLPSQCRNISSNMDQLQAEKPENQDSSLVQPTTRRSRRGFIPLSQLTINPEDVLKTRGCSDTEKLKVIEETEGWIVKIKPECADNLKASKVRFPKHLTLAFLGEVADSFKYCVNNVDTRYKHLKRKYQWEDTEEEKDWFYKPSSPVNPPNSDGINEGPFYPTSAMLPDASLLEVIRIDHYRQMFTWKKRHANTLRRKAEYILDFKRKNRNDLYKVKWCGLPKYAATWVRPIDISSFRYEFARKVFEFWEALKKVVPHKKMPIVRRSNYSISSEYVSQLCSEYQKLKRESMIKICAENPLCDALLIENEYDVSGSPFNFEFISKNKFSGTQDQLESYEDEKKTQKDVADAMGYYCKETCGECSWNLYKEYALAVHKSTYTKHKHYKYIEERDYWKVCHPPDFLIFECIETCVCKKEGNCKLDMLKKLRDNHTKNRFLVSRTGDDRGWGLTAMQPFKQGEPVIEYVGELMTEENFRQNETQIWRKGLMYSMDLTQNDRNMAAYTVDSSRMGNLSRLINHSCDPNLVTYKIIKEDRNINRPHPVLFAARDIEIGDELSFNYKLTIIDQNEGSSRDDDNSESDEDCITVEDGRPFLCQCGSKKCIDREKHEKPKKKNLKRKNDSKASKSKKPKIG